LLVCQLLLSSLPTSDPLPHTHISFAHCYKGQAGWNDVLRRFRRGGGTLYDLEFLENDQGRRVAAFGFHAGFAGAAAGALAYVKQKEEGGKGVLKGLTPYERENLMVEDVKNKINALGEGGVGELKVLVIGALGRCGSGAVDLFRKIGVKE
jgi:saccharopine dehydrogenase (NAD+, L-lysine-forming)